MYKGIDSVEMTIGYAVAETSSRSDALYEVGYLAGRCYELPVGNVSWNSFYPRSRNNRSVVKSSLRGALATTAAKIIANK